MTFTASRTPHALLVLALAAGLAAAQDVEQEKPTTRTASRPTDASGKPHPALRDPSKATEKAPAKFTARFKTTKGDFDVEVERKLSPRGADRFYNLVKIGYFDDCALFRVLPGFVVQFGINGDPKVNAVWSRAAIKDEPVKTSNTRGRVTFAMGGPGTRTTQVFANTSFSPFGKVTKGMEVLEKLHSGYGESASNQQRAIQTRGNEFLKSRFPKLDYIKKAHVLKK